MSSSRASQPAVHRPQLASGLGRAQLMRLGEFMYELINRLQHAGIPLPRAAISLLPLTQGTAALGRQDFLKFGEAVRDMYVRCGGDSYRPALAHGKLFWEALHNAMYQLALWQGSRRLHLSSPEENEHEEEAGDLLPLELEHSGQMIINGATPELEDPPDMREVAARIQFALTLKPQCSDAYLMRGTIEQVIGRYQDALSSYERAMQLAADRLGPDAFTEAGRRAKEIHMWFSDGARSYMQARAAVAHLLWRRIGDLPGAIAHFSAMLDLNPGDNQANGDALLCILLEQGDDPALGEALERLRYYEGDTLEPQDVAGTTWHYSNAVYHYRTQRMTGGSKQGERALKEAFRRNRYVPLFLLDPDGLPDLEELDSYSEGDTTEAALYVAMALKGWENTPGALAWLEEVARAAKVYPPSGRPIPPIHVLPPYR